MRMNRSGISLLGIAALTLGAAMKSQAIDIDLIITEIDANTIQLSGSDAANWVISGGGDSWTLQRAFALPDLQNGIAFASWTEPDDANKINSLQMSFFGNGGPSINFLSDQLATSDDSPVADSTPVTLTLFPNSSQIPYTIEVVDQGDGGNRSVPESTSTAVALVLGLIPLALLERRCKSPSKALS